MNRIPDKNEGLTDTILDKDACPLGILETLDKLKILGFLDKEILRTNLKYISLKMRILFPDDKTFECTETEEELIINFSALNKERDGLLEELQRSLRSIPLHDKPHIFATSFPPLEDYNRYSIPQYEEYSLKQNPNLTPGQMFLFESMHIRRRLARAVDAGDEEDAIECLMGMGKRFTPKEIN